jgi:hypothetical protein
MSNASRFGFCAFCAVCAFFGTVFAIAEGSEMRAAAWAFGFGVWIMNAVAAWGASDDDN